MPSGQITEIVGSERPKPVSPTPWWMLHTVGEVAPETRIIIAATVGTGIIFMFLVLVAAVLSFYNSPAAGRIWDIIQAVLSGGVGGSVVRFTRRRPTS